MSKIEEIIENIGRPIVENAFNELLKEIPSNEARKIIRAFSKKWKDYSRVALMALSCQSVGGDSGLINEIAKSLVLIGGGIDIHDDIVDSSFFRTKKHKRTLLGKYGIARALLIGDALLMGGLLISHKLWSILPREKANVVLEAIKQGLFELGSAEFEELKFVRNVNVTERQYLRIVYMKAADVEAYTKIGGIIGNGTNEEIEALAKFGRYLGMIAILRDDVEDTFYDDYELISRITKESLPYPIICSLKNLECRDIINKMLNNMEEQDIKNLKLLLRRNKSFEKTKKVINSLIKKAKIEANKVKNSELLLALFKH
ncbi:MAG: polyprenyl synthetase family protein [Candidatus Methanomethyliaceae archaeon]|nr:polyprenyl synthetase family protein [Candidatus Methanomethyliaceae archaeon]MDW7971105.1 polyprenyl synthetase family protein [Nitrososphaerota archaeon]